MPTLQVALWRGPHTETDDLDTAEETLTSTLDEQISATVETTRHGRLELDGAPFDSYKEYLEAFAEEADLTTGAVNVCLYYWEFTEGIDDILDGIVDVLEEQGIVSCDSQGEEESRKSNQAPWAGFDEGWLAPDRTPTAVVNTQWESVPFTCIYENFVVHEVLHAVLENAEAPQPGNDHSYGTIRDGDATPMLTGYVETFSKNQKPTVACDLETVPTENSHTTSLSDCTKDEIERKMTELYGDEAESPD